jgi:bacteriorhodopsin
MEKRKVRKGIETPLVIYGLQKQYFWRFLPFVVFGAGFQVYVLMSVLRSDPKQWAYFWISLCIVITVLVAVYIFFLSRGERKRHSFSKKEYMISNRDLRRHI